ncbi:MAG: hypothetical protein ACE5JN_06890 [Candidatus Methylomirabilia bacterium]
MAEGGNDRTASWVGWAVAWGSVLVGLAAVIVAANVYGEKTVLQTELRSCQANYAHILKEQGKAEARLGP